MQLYNNLIMPKQNEDHIKKSSLPIFDFDDEFCACVSKPGERLERIQQ